jgi:hypothetical protein
MDGLRDTPAKQRIASKGSFSKASRSIVAMKLVNSCMLSTALRDKL